MSFDDATGPATSRALPLAPRPVSRALQAIITRAAVFSDPVLSSCVLYFSSYFIPLCRLPLLSSSISALFGPSYIYFVVFFPSYLPLRHFLLNPIPPPISFPPSTSSSSHVTRARAPAHFPAAAVTNISQSFGQQPGPRRNALALTIHCCSRRAMRHRRFFRYEAHVLPSADHFVRTLCPRLSSYCSFFLLPVYSIIPSSPPPFSLIHRVRSAHAASSSLQQPLRFETRTHSHADLNHRTQFALGAVRADSAAMGQLNGTRGLRIYPLNAHAVRLGAGDELVVCVCVLSAFNSPSPSISAVPSP
ncbi:hypothetical protein C8J57DRAFT_1586033 [Mycena rebaudengoi]|nr:hypothetical protein C8J57DRAFT_1586033 [Mycena rebaudengoi]